MGLVYIYWLRTKLKFIYFWVEYYKIKKEMIIFLFYVKLLSSISLWAYSVDCGVVYIFN